MKKYTVKARNSILEAFKAQNIDKNTPVGVGVSGGADSSSLLLALSTIYHGDRASLVHVVIVNHQLQEVTTEISEKVANYAKTLGFTPHIYAVAIEETSRGAEADARAARYEAFEHAIETYDLAALLLGHTKSDQAEQVFLGLLRGSGTRSLAGMPEARDKYLRPYLFKLTREDTQRVCEENSYEHWNDPHNESDEYRRVTIRKLIKNVEKTTGQAIVEPLARTAKIVSEDADALDYYATLEYEKLEKSGWLTSDLTKLPIAMRMRVYKLKLQSIATVPVIFTSKHLTDVDKLITGWNGQKGFDLPARILVKRINNVLIFETKS